MMNLELHRSIFTDKSTIGKLSVNGVFECFTLEDVVREPFVKIAGQTAILPGVYKVIINDSARFKRRLPLLLNVPYFEGVRIHPGNTAVDTDGCILTGTHVGQNAIYESRIAFDRLFEKLDSALKSADQVEIRIM